MRSARRVLCACLVVIALCCNGCSSESPTMETPHRTSADQPALVALTAREIVDTLARQGLPIINPVDASATECAGIGCTQAVVTDRFRIYEFATSGAAQTYAGSRDMRQVETVVVAFAPVVGQDERDRYWSAIVRLLR